MATTVFWEFNQFSWGFLLIYNTIYYSMNKRRVKFVVSFAIREDLKKRLKRVTLYIFHYFFLLSEIIHSLFRIPVNQTTMMKSLSNRDGVRGFEMEHLKAPNPLTLMIKLLHLTLTGDEVFINS